MVEIFDFWSALWHEAWRAWDGLWVFQARRRPFECVWADVAPTVRAVVVETRARNVVGDVIPAA